MDWDLSGAVEDTRLLFDLGLSAASAPEFPRWAPGDEFADAREAALKGL